MKNGRVLVVDDQVDIRQLLATALSVEGHDVETAKSGPEALQALCLDAPPDLIVLDVQMPDVDGWDTLAAIRGRYGELGPRVVMCTVKGHPRDLILGWSLGCDGYVWKPFDITLLVEEIASVMERAPDERLSVRREAIGEAEMLLRAIA